MRDRVMTSFEGDSRKLKFDMLSYGKPMEELKKGSYMIHLIGKEVAFSGSILCRLKGGNVCVREARAWEVAVIQTGCKDNANKRFCSVGKQKRTDSGAVEKEVAQFRNYVDA